MVFVDAIIKLIDKIKRYFIIRRLVKQGFILKNKSPKKKVNFDKNVKITIIQPLSPVNVSGEKFAKGRITKGRFVQETEIYLESDSSDKDSLFENKVVDGTFVPLLYLRKLTADVYSKNGSLKLNGEFYTSVSTTLSCGTFIVKDYLQLVGGNLFYKKGCGNMANKQEFFKCNDIVYVFNQNKIDKHLYCR